MLDSFSLFPYSPFSSTLAEENLVERGKRVFIRVKRRRNESFPASLVFSTSVPEKKKKKIEEEEENRKEEAEERIKEKKRIFSFVKTLKKEDIDEITTERKNENLKQILEDAEKFCDFKKHKNKSCSIIRTQNEKIDHCSLASTCNAFPLHVYTSKKLKEERRGITKFDIKNSQIKSLSRRRVDRNASRRKLILLSSNEEDNKNQEREETQGKNRKREETQEKNGEREGTEGKSQEREETQEKNREREETQGKNREREGTEEKSQEREETQERNREREETQGKNQVNLTRKISYNDIICENIARNSDRAIEGLNNNNSSFNFNKQIKDIEDDVLGMYRNKFTYMDRKSSDERRSSVEIENVVESLKITFPVNSALKNEKEVEKNIKINNLKFENKRKEYLVVDNNKLEEIVFLDLVTSDEQKKSCKKAKTSILQEKMSEEKSIDHQCNSSALFSSLLLNDNEENEAENFEEKDDYEYDVYTYDDNLTEEFSKTDFYGNEKNSNQAILDNLCYIEVHEGNQKTFFYESWGDIDDQYSDICSSNGEIDYPSDEDEKEYNSDISSLNYIESDG